MAFNFLYELLAEPISFLLALGPKLILLAYKKIIEFATASVAEFLLVLIFLILIHLIVIICVLIYVAFATVFERKTLAAVQKRKGPN